MVYKRSSNTFGLLILLLPNYRSIKILLFTAQTQLTMRLFFYFKNGFGFLISSTKRPLDRCAAFQSGVNGLLSHQHKKPVNEIFSIGRVVKIGLELIFFNKITVKTRDYSRTWIFLSYS